MSTFYICSIFQGTPCDLITGEERRHASLYATVTNPEESDSDSELLVKDEAELNPSNHVACTVEMTSLNHHCEFKLKITFYRAFLRFMQTSLTFCQ